MSNPSNLVLYFERAVTIDCSNCIGEISTPFTLGVKTLEAYDFPFDPLHFMDNIQAKLVHLAFTGAVKHRLVDGDLGSEEKGDFSSFETTGSCEPETDEWIGNILDANGLVGFTVKLHEWAAKLKKEDFTPTKVEVELEETEDEDVDATYGVIVTADMRIEGHTQEIEYSTNFWREEDLDKLFGITKDSTAKGEEEVKYLSISLPSNGM